MIKSGAPFLDLPTKRALHVQRSGLVHQRESVPGFGKSPCCFPPGATQSTGSVDYPRLGKTCLGYFAAVSPGRLHWVWLDGLVGIPSSQLGPAGMGPCRVPPSICGNPLARCNVRDAQAALPVPNSPQARRQTLGAPDRSHTHNITHTSNRDGVSSPGYPWVPDRVEGPSWSVAVRCSGCGDKWPGQRRQHGST